MAQSHGQKVTTDPRSNQEIPEAVGVVTSDSLAAESLKGNGSFGEGNAHAAASKQPSKSTTTNNTDTSGATKLDPAPDAEAREAQQGWTETSQLNAGRGLGKDAGVGPTYATTSSGTDSYSSGGGNYSSNTSSNSGNASTAPTGGYAGASEQARGAGELRPKGKNLTEGGFDGTANTNFDIGDDNDPGRVAEKNFQLRDAQPGAEGGRHGTRDTKVTGESTYSALQSEEQA